MELQQSRALNKAAVPAETATDGVVETSIPSRLDALPWSGFHTRVVLALGITWILDGLEVTLAGALSGALKQSPSMHFSNLDLGIANSAYLAGAVLGALGFGWLTDRIGRKKLFFITLALYLSATAATALSWDVASYALFRFLTGAGIGGEYTAINSTIQELVPARYRGWTDLVINGSFWIGAAMGAVAAIVLLDPAVIDPDFGWRLAFLIGAILGLAVLLMRMWIPESPRWLMIHGRPDEAHAIVDAIERSVIGHDQDTSDGRFTRIRLKMRDHTPIREVVHTLLGAYRQRALVGLVLMSAQAFFGRRTRSDRLYRGGPQRGARGTADHRPQSVVERRHGQGARPATESAGRRAARAADQARRRTRIGWLCAGGAALRRRTDRHG